MDGGDFNDQQEPMAIATDERTNERVFVKSSPTPAVPTLSSEGGAGIQQEDRAEMFSPSTSKDNTGVTKKRTRKRKYAPALTRFNEATEAEKWTLQEKFKLLEGLKRYNEQSENISSWVETKTPEEVELMIAEIKGGRKIGDICREFGSEEAAPIDKWLKLVYEMTFYEPSNHSEYLSMVFGLIARNEEFSPGGHPHLDWKKLYLYVAALLSDTDKALPQLSDIESAVILDLMNQLGDSLQTRDTTQQRQVLEWKYQLCNHTGPKGHLNLNMIARALSNDFELPDEASSDDVTIVEPKTSNIDPSTSTGPSTSKDPSSPRIQSATVLKSPHSSPDLPQQASSSSNENGQLNVSKISSPERDRSQVLGNEGSSNGLGNEGSSNGLGNEGSSNGLGNEGSTGTEVLRNEENIQIVKIQGNLQVLGNEGNNPVTEDVGIRETLSNEDEINGASENQEEDNNGAFSSEDMNDIKVEFEKPTYFTLNPLCIPESLLTMKRRKTKQS